MCIKTRSMIPSSFTLAYSSCSIYVDGWMDTCMHGCVDEGMDTWTHGRKDGG